MSVTDSAVGAILSIPPEALADIQKAERYITNLQITSKRAAEAVKEHWGSIATSGLQDFIQKLSDAQNAMKGAGGKPIELNVSTSQAVNNVEQLANATKKSTEDVSKSVQDMGRLNFDWTQPKESLDQMIVTFKQLESELKHLKSDREQTAVGSSEAQSLNNVIQLLKEYIKLKEQSDLQNKTKITESDKPILDEQKRLLAEQLDLRRKINDQKKIVESGKITGSEKLEEEKKTLERLWEQYQKNKKAREDLNRAGLSEAGQSRFDLNAEKQLNDLIATQLKFRRELNAELSKANEYTAEAQSNKARISNTDEGRAQRQLNSDYKAMIGIIKEYGEIRAKAASENRNLTDQERNLIQALIDRYRIYKDDINRVASSFTNLAEARRKAFEADKTEQLARNAIALADATSKATDNSKKLTSEYKNLIPTIQKIAEQMHAFRATGGDVNSASYQAMLAQLMNLVAREKEIRLKGIAEVEQYRQDRANAAYQADLSAFVQAEAQKTAVAREQSARRAQDDINARRNSYQYAMASYNQLMTGSGNSRKGLVDSYADREIVIKRLESAIKHLDKADSDYAQKLQDLIAKLNELRVAQNGVKNAMKEPSVSKSITFADAQQSVAIANQTKALRDYEKAYRDLKAAMSGMSHTDPQWAQMNKQLGEAKAKIDEIKRKMGEFRNESNRTSGVMGQLQNRIAAAFSIAAIQGFIKKMVDVRAQFELQRVALGAILQDKDKADKIFLEVQQMALQSPFSIMQLERATKQIAAFGFEADKLKPTLKMLADMSAGLGVEIDRLVLVMGHLKARNYLEGTMVRQFTNAGFNVLGELAKYYTELEGRMVSVAEVQSRVKKKMVEFGDVEEVLKRVTSAGGMFYDMQKKQSDSLWGQMQRITDAYDLMLNEIGKDNQSIISKALTAIRTLISHWRTLAPMIKDVGYAMAGVFAVKGIQAMLIGFTSLGKILIKLPVYFRAIKIAIASMNLAWATTGIGALVAIVVTAIEVFRGLRAEANALKEEMGRIGEESVKNLNESITSFKLLADVMGDGNKTYVERKEAMKEMKRVYADILPQEKMEVAYIESLKGNYTELIDTISEYYRAKEYQHKYEAVINSSQAKAVQDEIEEVFKRMNKDQALGLIFSDAQLKAWAEKLANELNTGKIPNAVESIKKRVQEIFPDAKEIDGYFSESLGRADFTDVVDKVDKVRDAFGDISLSTSEAANALAMYNAQLGQMDFGQLDNEQEKIATRIREIETSIRNIEKSPQTTDPNIIAQRAKTLEQLNAELLNYRNAMDSVAEAKGKVVAKEFYEQIESETNDIQKVYKEYWKLGLQMRDLKTQGRELSPEFARLKKEQDACAKSADVLVEKFGLGNNMSVSQGFLDATETTYELNKKMNEVAKEAFPALAAKAQENIAKFKITLLKGEKTWWGFLSAIKSLLPEDWTKQWGDFAAKMQATDEEIKVLSGEAKSSSSNIDEMAESLGKLYSDISKDVSKKYGANMERMNTIMQDSSKTAKDMATELRNEAKSLDETTKAYDVAKKKGQEYVDSFLEGQQKTASEIEQMRKDSQAFAEAADRLWAEEKKEKKGHDKDPILELWKNRLKALEEYYKAREKARKEMSTYETEPLQRESFETLWKSLGFDQLKGLSLDELIAQGFDPSTLQKDFVSALETLEKFIPPRYVDFIKEIQRKIAGENIEIKFKVKEEEREELQKSITEMFDNYELTKELSNIGINVDLVTLFGGEPTTLQQLRAKINKMYEDAGGKSASENDQKMYEDALNKINDLELKAQKERLKNLHKYTLEAVSDRMRIEMKAQEEINKIRQSDEMNDATKNLAVDSIVKKKQADLDKLAWDTFKSSDLYIDLFENIEYASKRSIDFMIGKIESLKDSLKHLPADQVRAVVKQLDDLKERSAKLSDPFALIIKNVIPAIKAIRKVKDAQKQLNVAESNLGQSKANKKKYQDLVVVLGEQLQLAKANKNMSAEQVAEIQKQLDIAKANLAIWTGIVNQQEKGVTSLKKQIATAQDLKEKLAIGFGGVSDILGQVSQAIGQIKDDWQQIFGTQSDAFNDTFDTIADITGALSNLTAGLQKIMQGDIIGGVIGTVTGLFSTIASFFAIGDKKKERQIKNLTEKVYQLDRAYQRLEKSIKEAYTFDDYNAGYNQMQQNLELQKKQYEEMLRLEEDKKKTDDEKIKEYREKLEEISDAQKELKKERIEAMGSTTDYLSEAQSFVDVWLDAYKETGDGLDALSESWEEFIEGLFVKQGAAQIVSARLKKVIDMINTEIEKGATDLDLSKAVNNAREEWKKQAEIIEPLLEQLFGSYGLNRDGTGELILSDLQKGIQNITEPQAAAIEAYLNSMRFAVFRHTEQLDVLITTIQAQYGSGAENPVVTELKGIRGVLDSIDRKLGSVINSQGRNAVIRVGT